MAKQRKRITIRIRISKRRNERDDMQVLNFEEEEDGEI